MTWATLFLIATVWFLAALAILVVWSWLKGGDRTE